jgi:type I restriction enzyme S subunit
MKVYTKYKDSNDIWLGKVPEHWTVSSLKHFVDIVSGYAFKSEDYSDDIGIPIIRIGDISNTVNVLNAKKANPKNLDELERFIIKRGDLLLAMTGATIGKNCMFNSDEIAYVNQRVGLLRGKGLLSQDYLKYFIDTPLFREFISLTCSGSAQENISAFQISELKFLLPSSEEQTKITKYLDYQTSIIDELISKKQSLIELLKEKRQAIINETVTKGLKPDAKMKYSGIEWLGEIPEHWIVSKLKFLTSKIVDGAHFTPTYVENGVPFLRVTDIQTKEINLDKVKFIPEAEHIELIKRCNPEKGDVLLSKNGTIGITKIVDWDWEFSIFVSLCLIKFSSNLNPNYFIHFFNSSIVDRQISDSSKTTSVTNLHLEKIKELVIAIPPDINEQIELSNQLQYTLDEFDGLLESNGKSIEKLIEYRQSIIAEAVTGKIDVREWEKPNSKN